jgi:hypothetical protein
MLAASIDAHRFPGGSVWAAGAADGR